MLAADDERRERSIASNTPSKKRVLPSPSLHERVQLNELNWSVQSIGEDGQTLQLALKQFNAACEIKRIELFYEKALLDAIEDLADEQQCQILKQQIAFIEEQRSNYHLIVEAVEQRSGSIRDLKDTLSLLSHRRGLSLSELKQCIGLLTMVRDSALGLIEQLAEWRDNLREVAKEANQKTRYQPPFDFIYREKSVIRGLVFDTAFLEESLLGLYLNIERNNDPLFLRCSSKYRNKTNPTPIRTFFEMDKDQLVRMYQANTLFTELLQAKKHAKMQRGYKLQRSVKNYGRLGKRYEQYLYGRRHRTDQVGRSVHSYQLKQPKPLREAKIESVSTLETREAAINTINTHYYERQVSTQTVPTPKPRAITDTIESTNRMDYEQPTLENRVLQIALQPRPRQMKLVIPQATSVKSHKLVGTNQAQFIQPIGTIYMQGRIVSRRHNSFSSQPKKIAKPASISGDSRESLVKQQVNLNPEESQLQRLEQTTVPSLAPPLKPEPKAAVGYQHKRMEPQSSTPSRQIQVSVFSTMPLTQASLPFKQDTHSPLASLGRDEEIELRNSIDLAEEYLVGAKTIRTTESGHDVVPVCLTVRGSAKYLQDLAKQGDIENLQTLKQCLLSQSREFSSIYLHEVRKNGRRVAVATLHSQNSQSERTIFLLTFHSVALEQLELQQLLKNYIAYVWKNDPCDRMCYVQFIADHSAILWNVLLKLGYAEESTKLGWKQIKPVGLSASRTIPCAKKIDEESTLEFELVEVLTKYTSADLCTSLEIDPPNNYNHYEEVVSSALVRSAVQLKRIELTKDSKDAIRHLSVKPADVLKGKIVAHESADKLNDYLEKAALDNFDDLEGLGSTLAAINILYDSFSFEYFVERGCMFMRTDGLHCVYGRNKDCRYLLMRIPRSNANHYLAIIDDEGSPTTGQQADAEILKVRTRRFLERSLNSTHFTKQVFDKTVVRLRMFNKHLYGRAGSVDGTFSIFMRLHFKLAWTDYLEGAKRYGTYSNVQEFTRPFFAAVLMREGDIFRALASTQIEEEDFTTPC